jgi:hypothetical protein
VPPAFTIAVLSGIMRCGPPKTQKVGKCRIACPKKKVGFSETNISPCEITVWYGSNDFYHTFFKVPNIKCRSSIFLNKENRIAFKFET